MLSVRIFSKGNNAYLPLYFFPLSFLLCLGISIEGKTLPGIRHIIAKYPNTRQRRRVMEDCQIFTGTQPLQQDLLLIRRNDFFLRCKTPKRHNAEMKEKLKIYCLEIILIKTNKKYIELDSAISYLVLSRCPIALGIPGLSQGYLLFFFYC